MLVICRKIMSDNKFIQKFSALMSTALHEENMTSQNDAAFMSYGNNQHPNQFDGLVQTLFAPD